MPPESDGEFKDVAKELYFGVDSQGLTLKPEDDIEEMIPVVGPPYPDPDPSKPTEQFIMNDKDLLATRLLDEKIRALESALRPKGDLKLDARYKRGDTHQSDEKIALEGIACTPISGPQPDERDDWIAHGEIEVNEELQQSSVSEQADLGLELEPERRTIHILGIGPFGKYIAHALAGLAEAPPVTLLMHKPLLMQQWHDEGASIHLLRRGQVVSKSNFNIESSSYMHQREAPRQRFPGFGKNLEHTAEQPSTVIDSLIVTTEGHITVSALSAIKHRLRSTSTICFVQDGLGVTNLVDQMVFPDPESRPSYMLGNMSHDLLSTERKFTLLERKPGKIYVNMAPRNMSPTSARSNPQKENSLVRRMDYGWTPTSKWLMRTLSRAPELDAIGMRESLFYEMQLQKIAIISVIGPLSVIYDCYNEELLCNYSISRSMKLLIKDISTILMRLPEVSKAAKIEKKFSPESLERIIVGVLGKTGKASTSMLQAVRKGERTDIDFYDGYLLNRAMELGIECPNLEMVVVMVKGKQQMKSREKRDLIPFKV